MRCHWRKNWILVIGLVGIDYWHIFRLDWGYIIGVGIFGIVAFLGITKERLEQRRKLRGVFGKYWSKDRKDKWESLTKQFKQGQEVSGRVVCRFYYGVFVDTGQGFPALLKIGDSKNGPASMGDYFCDDHIPGPCFNLVNLVTLLIMLGLLFGIGRLIYRWLY